jgi:hypothetical protein
MKIEQRNFPYPIISPWSDDVQPYNIGSSAAFSYDKENYYFNYEITSENNYILELLLSRHAQFVIHIECGQTFYRQITHVIWSADENTKTAKGKIDISAKELEGDTEISFLICADRDISDYFPQGLHPDYGNQKFRMGKGYFIAACGTFKFYCKQDYDTLKKISSIIIFKEDKKREEGAITADFNSDKLVGLLPVKLFKQYNDLRDRKCYSNILGAMLAMPVLMEGLACIKYNTDPENEYGSYKWFRVIFKKLNDIGYDIKNGNCLEAAQKIFEMPYDRANKELENLMLG